MRLTRPSAPSGAAAVAAARRWPALAALVLGLAFGSAAAAEAPDAPDARASPRSSGIQGMSEPGHAHDGIKGGRPGEADGADLSQPEDVGNAGDGPEVISVDASGTVTGVEALPHDAGGASAAALGPPSATPTGGGADVAAAMSSPMPGPVTSVLATQPGQPRAVRVLVELFTSEGCSSCPPADEMLADLAARPDTLALALHVDYWDYLGWADAYAHPGFTQRQKDYARREGARAVFTPQVVIGGVAGASAPRPATVLRAIEEQAATIALRARVDDRGARRWVTLEAPGAFANRVWVSVVRYIPAVDSTIRGGENRGRVIRHVNVVRDWDHVAQWDGTAPLVLDVAVSAAQGRGEGIALVVQEGLAGPGGHILPGAALGAITLE